MGQLSQAGGKGPFGKLKSLANLKRMMRPERMTELMHRMMGQDGGSRPAGKGAQKVPVSRDEIKRKRKLERKRRKQARKKR